MRLAVYEDSIYRRDGETLSAEQAFALFLWGLAAEVDRLVVLGRLDPSPGRTHHVVVPGPRAAFVPLPFYPSLLDAPAVVRALPGTVRRLWRVLGDVDALWVNGPGPMSIVAALLGLARRRRVVLGVRQATVEYARRRHPGRRAVLLAFSLMELVWRALARVTPVTLVGPELYRSYAAAPRRHALSVSLISQADVLVEAAVAPRDDGAPLELLSVGRLDAEKNPLLLADVLADLGPGYRLRVVGEGPLAGELEARLARLGVAGRAELVGYVPVAAGLFELYRRAQLLVHVSWTEGLPQVLLEAFAARLPVVATDVGGVAGVAEGAALLVPPGDAAALAAAVRRLAEDAPLRERLVAEGVRRVLDRTAEAERGRLLAFIRG